MHEYHEFFSVESTAEPGVAIVRVRGEIDLATAPRLEAALQAVDGRAVDLDLSDVTFCDASGLRVLAGARKRLGGRLRLRGSSEPVRRVARVVAMGWLVQRDADLDADLDPDLDPDLVGRRYGDGPS